MANSSPDPYAVLGLSRGASQDEVRRAYRKLARQYHPDVRPGDKAAEERFKQVTAANEVLGDGRKRKLYDEFGEMGLREGFDAAQARAYAGMGGGAGMGGAGGGFDLGDMLGDLFGGGGARAGHACAAERTGTVEVSFVGAVRGTELHLQLPQQVRCAACQGDGGASGSAPQRCAACRGKGQLDLGGMRTRCPHCRGKGQQRPACPTCGGQGTQERKQAVTVRVPPGAAQGSKLRVPGGSTGGPGWLLEVRVKSHPWFRREGLDLVVRLPLTVGEAALGATVPVPTPTGAVKLRVPPGAQPGTRLRLRGRGVTRGSQMGDLFAELELVVPQAQTPEQQAAARTLDAAYPDPVRERLHF